MKTPLVEFRAELIPAASMAIYLQPSRLFKGIDNPDTQSGVELIHTRARSIREAQGYVYDADGYILNDKEMGVRQITAVDVPGQDLEITSDLAHIVSWHSRASYRVFRGLISPLRILDGNIRDIKDIRDKWQDRERNKYFSNLFFEIGTLNIPGKAPVYNDTVRSNAFLMDTWQQAHLPL
ncbi:MAG: hypothetical protein WAS36_02705 [Candidatus Saccharimonadales bacterium]